MALSPAPDVSTVTTKHIQFRPPNFFHFINQTRPEAGIPFSMKKVAQEMEKQYLCRFSPFDEEAWEKEEAEESQLEIS